jgi:hypothetical protein
MVAVSDAKKMLKMLRVITIAALFGVSTTMMVSLDNNSSPWCVTGFSFSSISSRRQFHSSAAIKQFKGSSIIGALRMTPKNYLDSSKTNTDENEFQQRPIFYHDTVTDIDAGSDGTTNKSYVMRGKFPAPLSKIKRPPMFFAHYLETASTPQPQQIDESYEFNHASAASSDEEWSDSNFGEDTTSTGATLNEIIHPNTGDSVLDHLFQTKFQPLEVVKNTGEEALNYPIVSSLVQEGETDYYDTDYDGSMGEQQEGDPDQSWQQRGKKSQQTASPTAPEVNKWTDIMFQGKVSSTT